MALKCTGVFLVFLAVHVLSAAYAHLTRLDFVYGEPPICLPLDLSKQAVYSGPYVRTYDAVLDDQLRVVIDGAPSAAEARDALNGLIALVTLQDDSNRILWNREVDVTDFRDWKNGLAFTLPVQATDHRTGDFHLSIDVSTPAKGICGRPHCLLGEYGVTGVETITISYFAIPAAWIALLLGVTLLCVTWRFPRKIAV